MGVATFASHAPFITQLADYIAKQPADVPLLVLLPSKRACQSLSNALPLFTDGSERPSLDILSLNELAQSRLAKKALHQSSAAKILPAISPLSRHVMLARLCMAAGTVFSEQPLQIDQAMELAGALASLLDEAQRQQVPLEQIEQLPPEDFAVHWQRVLVFLTIITRQWPEILRQQQQSDPVAHRNAIYAAIAEYFTQQSSRQPTRQRVIIAGSTGSNTAAAQLMQAVAQMPGGEVILPAIPIHMPKIYWESLEPSHAHYYPMKFLRRSGVAPADVRLIETMAPPTSGVSRQLCMLGSMLPAPMAYEWQQADAAPQDLQGLVCHASADSQSQAMTIADSCLALHELHGCASVIIVSEKRSSTKQIMAALSARGLAYDASEARSLAEDASAGLFRLVLLAAQQPADPVVMLALLKHKDASLLGDEDMTAAIDWLELSIFRQGRHYGYVAAMIRVVQGHEHIGDALRAQVLAMLEAYDACLAPFAKCLRQPHMPCDKLLAAHHDAWLLALGRLPEEPENGALEGAEPIGTQDEFTQDEGEIKGGAEDPLATMHHWLERFSAQIAGLGTADAFSYQNMLDDMLSRELLAYAHRPEGAPPLVIRILPSEEARLETADAVILADFQEGVWPPEVAANPWLSRQMQQHVGLDLAHIRASRMAHDVMMLFHARHVLLSSVLHDGSAATMPSRFAQRMAFYLQASGQLPTAEAFFSYGELPALAPPIHTRQAQLPCSRPEPCPPRGVRPTRLSVSDIELLRRDPYSIYIKHILKLKPLEDLVADNQAALYGNVVHRMLELFCMQHPKVLPADAEHVLDECATQALAEFDVDSALAALWQPKLKAAAGHFIGAEQQRRPQLEGVKTEVSLAASVNISGVVHSIYGRIDRVEHYSDGSLGVVDYKTGSLPLARDVKQYVASQLPICAWLLDQQQQKSRASGAAAALEYWRVSNKELTIQSVAAHASSAQTKAFLEQLLGQYQLADTAYLCQPDPAIAPAYPRYNHLARVDEWR